jgi:hypothetical protein
MRRDDVDLVVGAKAIQPTALRFGSWEFAYNALMQHGRFSSPVGRKGAAKSICRDDF